MATNDKRLDWPLTAALLATVAVVPRYMLPSVALMAVAGSVGSLPAVTASMATLMVGWVPHILERWALDAWFWQARPSNTRGTRGTVCRLCSNTPSIPTTGFWQASLGFK